jgi:FkbM family methyltransferase
MIDFSKLSKLLYILSNPLLITSVLDGMIVDTYYQLNQPWFHKLNIDTVIDIGANVGKTVITFNKLLPNAHIYAFEPLPDCYEILCRKIAKLPNCDPFNLALGTESSEILMNKSSYLPSSSILEMDKSHSDAFPFTSGSEAVKIKIVPLDSMSLEIGNSLLIKLDVQGYEDRVIDGGMKVFSQANIVILEISYKTLYKDQVLFDGIYTRMKNLGFVLAGTLGNLKDPITGSILEADAIFIKSHLIE